MEVPVGTGANGGEKDEAKGDGVQLEKGLARVEEEGVAESGPLALDLRVPGKVIDGSSRFQQFFLIYAKLMAGLRDSKVRESDMTPLAMHKVVISTGKSSREELDWAICDICPEMSEPTSISILMTSP